MRVELKQYNDYLEKIFLDIHGESSYKKCIDVMSIEKKFADIGIQFSQGVQGNIGRILRCFGDVQYILKELTRMPEKDAKELQREQLAAAAMAAKKEEMAKDPKKTKTKKKDKEGGEENKPEEFKAPPKPITVLLYETSIYDLLQAIDKMQDYDFTLKDLGIIFGNFDEELLKNSPEEEKAHSKTATPVQSEKHSEVHSDIEAEDSEFERMKKPPTPVVIEQRDPNLYSEDDEYE